ncbi:MAG TPA: TerC family protein [Candidatus Omnitrophota bacterium]|jgi:tellurite resistance protein TerC|nr:MAG: Inner membrane protein alx [Candidatus Omnitrophica bacterium ADurb.Bin314]HOE69393.1 TerC family protein [Candidatus Omnitrophota bacterium]HQB93867.1 TerC family protein [Candidatus Omnitrophota bacterium]
MSDMLAWSIFGVIVVVLLALDLGVFHRKAHEIKMKEALIWSAVWIGVALLFNVGVYFMKGKELAVQFLAGYLLEKSLSVDNLFVFLLIFNYFHLPTKYQHEVLFWGIIGALVFRAIFIVCGLGLLHYFSWMIYVFGAFLVWTGVKLAFEKDKKVEPENNVFVKMFRRFFPLTNDYHDGKFFVRIDGVLHATPLIVILLVVESTDIVFAVDSIPAVLAISRDAFIIYTSNVFAILGLRALYFALAQLMKLFHHLHYGLSLILVLIGIKMIVAHFVHIPTVVTLGTIFLILTVSVVASLIWPQREEAPNPRP